MPEQPIISLADQAACAQRELSYRLRVYPRWVENKKMTQAFADQQINTMRAIVYTLTGLAEKDRLL